MDGSWRVKQLQQRRYAALLISLLLLAVLHPVTRGRYVGQGLSTFFYAIMFLTAIFAVGQKRRPFVWALVLGVPAFIISWITYAVAHLNPEYMDLAILARDATELLFLLFAVGVVLHDVVAGDEVNADKLCGAMCAYLMIGVAFGTVFSIIELLEEGSFEGVVLASELAGEIRESEVSENDLLSKFEQRGEVSATLMYYSFVTLTTLGYGDIIPVTSAARTFSWLEAVCGQLYLAVLIARLVGLHIVHTRESQE